MRRVFSQGLDAVVGYVLPLRRFGAGARRRWQSEAWEMREGKIFLVQGDSSMGVRLPLASLALRGPEGAGGRGAGARSARARRRAAAARRAARARRAVEWPRRAHGADRAGARTAAVRLHPPAHRGGGLAVAGGRHRADGGLAGPTGGAGGLQAALRPPPGGLLRHPRPRRDRGQRAAGVQLGRDRGAHRTALRTGPAMRPYARRSS